MKAFIRSYLYQLILMLMILLLYCMNRFWFTVSTDGWIQYICRCHVNDLLAPLFILNFAYICLKEAGYEMKSYIVILLIGMSAAFCWEYVIPLIKSSSVTDVYDLFSYFIGTNLYYVIQKQIAVQTVSK